MTKRSAGYRLRRLFDAARDLSTYKIFWATVAAHLSDLSDLDIHDTLTLGSFAMPSDTNLSESDIPKLVFQTWKSRNVIPDNYRYWMASINMLNPDYLHILWDDCLNRAFIINDFKWFIDKYDSYPAEIYRADIVRFFFLFRFGGFYIDMDTECLKPLEEVRLIGGIVLGRMGRDEQFSDTIPNAIMASAPRQLFWLLAIAIALEKLRIYSGNTVAVTPELMTGPVILKEAVDFYRQSNREQIEARAASVIAAVGGGKLNASPITLLKSDYFYPINWNNMIHNRFKRLLESRKQLLTHDSAKRLFPHSFLVTYWTQSWSK